MKFWIVTPSYNQLDWLKLCIASVRDQVGSQSEQRSDGRSQKSGLSSDCCSPSSELIVHHHIQDACSTDGTREFLAEHLANSQQLEASTPNVQRPEPNASLSGYTFSYASEPDNGMYDAINKGWKLAPEDVDVIAHLNCDEQYLPNALKTIASFMKSHPKADVVLADMIVVDSGGEYICHRRALKPFSITSRFCCAGSTATTFQRAWVTKDKEVFFDTGWRNLGDKVWYNMLHRAGCRFLVCNQLVSVFADTGANLNWTEEGLREKKRYEDEFLNGSRLGGRLVSLLNGARRYAKEFFIKSPVEYSIYQSDAQHRIVLPIKSPRGVWHKKW